MLQMRAILDGSGRGAEAEAVLREAERVSAEIVALSPTPDDRMAWIAVRSEMAQRWAGRGAAVEAERELLQVLDLLTAWTREAPAAYRSHILTALANLGVLYTRARTREAIGAYSRMVELDPSRYGAYHNLVLALGDADDPVLRDPGRAVDLARKATQVPHEKHEAWSLLGYALACDGRWKDALSAFARAVEENGGSMTDDDYGENLVYVALCHARLGDRPAARDWLRRAAAWIAELDVGDLSHAKVIRRRAEVTALLGSTESK